MVPYERILIEELDNIPNESYQLLISNLKTIISDIELPFHTSSEGGRVVLHYEEILERRSFILCKISTFLNTITADCNDSQDTVLVKLYSELYIRTLSWFYHHNSQDELNNVICTMKPFTPSVEAVIDSVREYFSFRETSSSRYVLLSREDRVKSQIDREQLVFSSVNSTDSLSSYWKNCPSVVYGFVIWLQLVSNAPNNQFYRSKHLHSILPILFCLFDDWEQQHQVLGCKILLSFLLPPKVDPNVYHERNWIPVIKKSLFFLLSIHNQDSEFIHIVSNTIISLSVQCEQPYSNQDHIDTIHLLMNSFLSNNSIDPNPIYNRIGFLIHNHLRGECLVHFPRWISILDKFTLGIDEKSNICLLLTTTNAFLAWCWPRIFAYTKHLLAFLVKISINVPLNEKDDRIFHEWFSCFNFTKNYSIKKEFDDSIEKIIITVPRLECLLDL